MIKINFLSAVSLYLTFSIFLVFILGIFYTYSDKINISNPMKQLQQCPYCTYMVAIYDKSKNPMCPNCKSYLPENENEIKSKSPSADRQAS